MSDRLCSAFLWSNAVPNVFKTRYKSCSSVILNTLSFESDDLCNNMLYSLFFSSTLLTKLSIPLIINSQLFILILPSNLVEFCNDQTQNILCTYQAQLDRTKTLLSFLFHL